MIGVKDDVDPGVYLLADHLDVALAVGEDLQKLDVDLSGNDEDASQALATFVARVSSLEANLIGRLLQARRRVAELKVRDAAMRSVFALFLAETTLLLDIVRTYGEIDQARFNTGDDRTAYLRSRRLVADHIAGATAAKWIAIDDGFSVGGMLRLGGLLDIVSACLGALDSGYGIYSEIEEPASVPNDVIAKPEMATATADANDNKTPETPVTGEASLKPSDGIQRIELQIASGTKEPRLTPGSLAEALKTIGSAESSTVAGKVQ